VGGLRGRDGGRPRHRPRRRRRRLHGRQDRRAAVRRRRRPRLGRRAGRRRGRGRARRGERDVLDEQGGILAGSTAPPDAPRFPLVEPPTPGVAEQTVIGCLVTDATLTKTEACRAADLAHTGIARTVEPPHTAYDGDALFLLCAQRVPATVDLVAHLGAQAVAAAVRQGVRAAG
jgi:L-aminopeptidase/D-esterase-like protein